MSLPVKFNAVLLAAFALAALLAGWVCWRVLENNARREVLSEAGLMLDSATAVRAYTANEILPLLKDHMQEEFPPQSSPFYAATQNFLHLRERHPQFTYKEATLNPTNPRDRAADWEGDIIQRFRNDPHADQMVGERDTPMGRSLYLARPIRNEGECLTCHSVPSAAPRSLVARYGSDNGYGWQPDEIVGAQVVSVPFASATESAHEAFRAFVVSLMVIFAAVLAAGNALLYLQVLRPARKIAQVAEQLSLGDESAEDFPTGGAPELQALTRSFDRMRKSLEKALKLLGA